jgi:hypothetical protein
MEQIPGQKMVFFIISREKNFYLGRSVTISLYLEINKDFPLSLPNALI